MTTWEQVPKRKTNNFLTPAQFETWKRAQNKPHATYGGYTSWVKSTRAARDNARLAADPYGQNAALSQFRAGLLTPAQQAAQAQSMINAKIKGALGQIEDTYSGARSDTADAAKRAQGYMQAFANMTATTPDQVASVYNDAADRLKGWGTGLTGAFQQAEESENAKAAAALAATGTKTSIPVNDFDPAAMRNVLQYTGVVTPGKNLQEEAANAAAMARFQRAAGASQVESVAQDYLQKGTALDKEMAGKKAALLATEPDLYQQALSGLQTQGQQGWSTFLNALQQTRATDIQSSYLNNALRQAGATITGYDPTTGLPTYESVKDKADAAAKKAEDIAKAKAKKAGVRTAAVEKRDSDTVKYLTDARAWAAAQVKPGTEQAEIGSVPMQVGKTAPIKDSKGHIVLAARPIYAKPGGGTTTNKNKAIMKPIYEQQPIAKPQFTRLWDRLTETLATQLGRYGYSRKQIRNFAHDVLDDYYTVGEIRQQAQDKKDVQSWIDDYNVRGQNERPKKRKTTRGSHGGPP
jgi:hypothetical protein